ncbi:Eco47II family restriction endonuclease, partial [Vibrio parahaemolyticus]|uniref:Eco47II family restriction endonuclease n=1 Tax=Vibrio parahaemolyticus TaxID=670 RepID=UPI001123F9AB
TTKGEDRKASFEKLETALKNKPADYKAYYVTILRNSHERICKPFTPSDNTGGEAKNNPSIIHMDGESFYSMLTGEDDALSKAFDSLKKILKERYNDNDNDN